MNVTDPPLMYQLKKHQEFLITLGSGWHTQVEEFSPITDWPIAIQHFKHPVLVDLTAEEWEDLEDFSALGDHILELDDQHTAFLEDEHPKDEDEDEVECLLMLLEISSEHWYVFFGSCFSNVLISMPMHSAGQLGCLGTIV